MNIRHFIQIQIICLIVMIMYNGLSITTIFAVDSFNQQGAQISSQIKEFYYTNPSFKINADTVNRQELFKQGDRMGFTFSATQDAYFILLAIDPLNHMSILYPYTVSEISIISANQPYQMPNTGIVQGPFGQETIKVFAFIHKPPGFDQWAGRDWQGDSSDSQAFMRMIREAEPYANQTTLSIQTCQTSEYKTIRHERARSFQKGLDAQTLTRGIMVMPYIHIPIHFEYNQWHLNASGIKQANELGQALTHEVFRHRHIRIIGHTDSRGSHAYNQTLSEKRALAVKQYIETHYSLATSQILTEGKGETELIYPEDTEDAHALNRRVELRLD